MTMLSATRLATLAAFVAIAAVALLGIAGRADVGGLASTLSADGPTSNDRFVVASVTPASRLRVGNRVEIRDRGDLAAFALDALAKGSTLRVERIGPSPATIDEPVSAAPRRLLGAPLIAALELLFVGSALFIAGRGRAGGSMPLAWLFSILVLLINPTSPWWPHWAILTFAIVGGAIAALAFLCATEFATAIGNDPRAMWALRTRRVGRAVAAVAIAVNVVQSWVGFFTPLSPAWAGRAVSAVFLVQVLCCFAALVLAYVNATPGERQRVTWVAASVGLGVLGFIVTVLASIAGISEPLRDYPLLLLLAMPFGCGYAILRYRLLDMAFVVNRATVFGVTSLIVLGAVALLETGLQSLLGAWIFRSGLYVQLGLAVAVGIATRPLHERVDRVVDDLFFRARHETERTLRAFARDVAHIDDADVAISRTVDVVARATRMRCEMLLASEGGSYAVLASSERSGAPTLPVDRNDGAVVRLFATRDMIDLHDVETAIGGRFAFPMFARNRLSGILVCGGLADDDTAYAPDELEAIATVARATALALDVLRIEALEAELEVVRRGQAFRNAM